MNPNSNLLTLLNQLSNELNRRAEQQLQAAFGITLTQYHLLLALEWNPKVPQRQVAAAVGQSDANVSRQTSALKRAGLVSTQPDPNNRRRHLISATPKGMQVTEAAQLMLRNYLQTELKLDNRPQLAGLLPSLQALHDVLDRAEHKPLLKH